jgi:hypothetical protein
VVKKTNAAGVRVEVWDKDIIGSDEFMGYAFVEFAKLKSSTERQDLDVTLLPRKNQKKADKVSGALHLEFLYYTHAWYAENATKVEAEWKKAQEEKAKKTQEMTAEFNKGRT